MRFTKMEGAGNDYVYVDLFEESIDLSDAPQLARDVSDRHFGIGGDGLILLAPSKIADVRMVMFNADGSRAEMCGNGVRCLAKLAHDRGRAASNPMRVETDGGVRDVELRFRDGAVSGARVSMGVPAMESALIPVVLDDEPGLDGERVVDRPLVVLDRTFAITCVSMGNPHCVVYVDDVDAFDVARYGPAIESHKMFPEHANVEFVQVLDSERVRQRTWERGSGETLACGTGACAAAVAGRLTARGGAVTHVTLRGGELFLEWDGEGPVFMSGPAVEVFRGDWSTRD
ncbi:MAG: diaminopimelate epimerase [Planctomycetota bacterium]